MSFFARAASSAALFFCVLGLGAGTTASQAAELTSVSLPAVVAPVTFPTMSLPTVAIPASADPATPAPSAHFASLEEAVAAHSAGETAEGLGAAVSDDVSCLAGAIYFEAKGEPLSGQLAVANVILNRARSGRFPSDVCGVVTQRGQFSFVREGRVPAIAAAARGYRTAVALARVALARAWDSPAPQALFFHARRIGVGRGIQIAAIGNHIFYR